MLLDRVFDMSNRAVRVGMILGHSDGAVLG